jgi:hypothetical protein
MESHFIVCHGSVFTHESCLLTLSDVRTPNNKRSQSVSDKTGRSNN